MVKYPNENENMVEMHFKRQQVSLPSTLEVNKDKENLSYNEEITSRGNEELVKLQRVENDAQTLKDLVVKEDDPTSLESHEKIKDDIVKTTPEMAPWGERYMKS